MATDNPKVTAMIEQLSSPQQEICARLRTMIGAEFPALEEKWRWSRPVYATADGNICYMIANKNDVNFGFEHGVKLDDPKGLLIGTGANMRHIKIRKLEELDLDYCQMLLVQAVQIAKGDDMTTSYKPTGYTSVAPYLIVDGAGRTLEFLKQVFAAEQLRHFADPSGRIMHAEVRIDDTVLMLADSAEGWPAIASNVHIYVPDVDATYKRALEAGAVSVQAPEKKDDADKRAGVKDAGGITWWIATQVE